MVTEAVLDSSVILAFVTKEEHSEWAAKKISEHEYFHILELNYYEVANALKYKISERFGIKDVESSFTQAVELMDLYDVHSFGEIIVEAMNIALELNIAVYDAAFISLAEKLDMKLLTLDMKLVKKLEKTKYFRIVEYLKK
jgi:predicted nucleic acid-binding protein